MHLYIPRTAFVLPLFLLMLTACTTVVLFPVLVPATAFSDDTLHVVGAGTAATGALVPATLASGATTPEAAVEAYLLALAAGDMQGMLAMSSAEMVARNFDFAAYVDRLRALPVFHTNLPPNDVFLRTINQARNEQQLSNQIANLVIALLAGDVIDMDEVTIAPLDRAWAEEVTPLFDSARLRDIRLLVVAPPQTDAFADPRYAEMAQRQALVHGADELTERVAGFTFEGHTYLLGFTLLRFGDQWYIQTQTSPLAGTDATGVPIRQE